MQHFKTQPIKMKHVPLYGLFAMAFLKTLMPSNIQALRIKFFQILMTKYENHSLEKTQQLNEQTLCSHTSAYKWDQQASKCSQMSDQRSTLLVVVPASFYAMHSKCSLDFSL